MKTVTFEILPVTIKDLKHLKELGEQTFTESYAAMNTEQNMRLYLKENFSESVLSHELEDPAVQHYLAYSGAKPVAYTKLNFGEAQKEIQDKKSIEIERIYVLKEFQRNNIGKYLLEKIVGVAKQQKMDFIWLGVWEKNFDAIKFYKRNGFVEFGKHPFKLGLDEQTDILMRLETHS